MKAAELAMPKLDEYPQRWHDEWRTACHERIEAARAVELEPLSDAELLGELQRVIDDILRPHLVTHFDLTMPHMVGMYELDACCRELLGWEGESWRHERGWEAQRRARRRMARLRLGHGGGGAGPFGDSSPPRAGAGQSANVGRSAHDSGWSASVDGRGGSSPGGGA